MLGLTAYQLGQIDAAAALVEQATKVKVPFPDALANLGSIYRKLGRTDEAETCLRDAIEAGGSQAALHFNLGNILLDQGRLADAAQSFENAVQIDPTHGPSWNGLGLSLRGLDRWDEAYKALREATTHAAAYHQAWFNYGNLLRDYKRDLDGAEAALRQAIKLKPDYALAWNTRSIILGDLGRIEDALDASEEATRCDPDSGNIASTLLMNLQYLPNVSPAYLKEKHVEWMWLHAPEATTCEGSHTGSADPEKPLRVGFLSPDLGAHPVGYFLSGLLPELKSSQLNTVCLSTRAPLRDDQITGILKQGAGEWHTLAHFKKGHIAEQIRKLDIDILFDLSGHTGGSRLVAFAARPAPVQITWLGYVGTTGLATMDYILADRHHIPPDDDAYYTERVLRMPNGYALYTPPPYLPDVAPLPALENGVVTFGCLNNPSKLSDPCLGRFADVLKAVPNSRLRLQFRGLDTPSTQQRLSETFRGYGIDENRIDLKGGGSHQEFLEAYNTIDIALDTYPYSGGLTTCEALWMGVPVITCPGDTFASRHSASHLTTAGLADCVAADVSGLVAQAKTLAADLDQLSALRAGLRQQASESPLGDAPRFAQDFEQVMRGAWRAYCESNT